VICAGASHRATADRIKALVDHGDDQRTHFFGALIRAIAQKGGGRSDSSTPMGMAAIKDKRRELLPDQWPQLEIAFPCRHSLHK
jgi:hypothetical protein